MVSGGDTACPPNLRMQKGGRLQPPLEKTRGGFRSLNSQAGAGGGEEDPGTPPALCVFWATAEVSQMNRLKARLGGSLLQEGPEATLKDDFLSHPCILFKDTPPRGEPWG